MKEFLEARAAEINSPAFINEDPVQFPRRFSDLRDIEIAALLSSSIAWGNRKMICRNADRILSLMADDPARFVSDGEYEQVPDEMNLHRTFFGRDFKYLLRGYHRIMRDYGSLDAFCRAVVPEGAEGAPWLLAGEFCKILREENDGKDDPRCFPAKTDTTALKRFNMALRWLVRNDGIVDLGVWKSLKPSQLYIPLDVHVGRTARDLGLLSRRSNDRKAVEELTAHLREWRPDDPCLFDYALFGLGVESSRKAESSQE